MTEDRTLWATYRYQPDVTIHVATELNEGEYLYVNRTAEIALAGVPEGGIMAFDEMDVVDDNQHYWIEFVGTDTAYITHAVTGTPIGYSGTNMAAVASPWLVYHEGEETVFYMLYEGKSYVLWLNIMEQINNEIYVYAGLMKGNVTGGSPMALLEAPIEGCEPMVTCHPGETQGIEEVMSEGMNELMHEWRIPLGNYELIIKDGKKYIKLKE